MNVHVCTSSELLAILSSADTHAIDIVHKWQVGSTFLSLAVAPLKIFSLIF